ncbi:MAG TPA: hypothetical protein VMF89_34960 [Polyangiales bacterium]|nr:hypothetical protein [Polyangiales bacterium]
MLGKLIKSADLRQLSSFVSPAFFDVLPARKIWSRGRQIMTSKGNEAYREALALRAGSLRALPLAVALPGHEAGVSDALGSDARAHATRLVTLYFEQIFSDSPTLLDLRPASAHDLDGQLRWQPAPWLCKWDAEFLAALRGLYRGFYAPDDALLTRSLVILGIEFAEDLFREHFGANPVAQRFVMKDFVSTFHQVFLRCRERRREMHEDFLPLGVYLATLYEHLDSYPIEVNVAACYARATRRPVRASQGSDAWHG